MSRSRRRRSSRATSLSTRLARIVSPGDRSRVGSPCASPASLNLRAGPGDLTSDPASVWQCRVRRRSGPQGQVRPGLVAAHRERNDAPDGPKLAPLDIGAHSGSLVGPTYIMFRHFSQLRVLSIHGAAVTLGLYARDTQQTLLAGIDPRFVSGIPQGASESERLLITLHTLNSVKHLEDGSTPLRHWLENALVLKKPFPEADVFKLALKDLGEGRGRPLLAERRGSARKSAVEPEYQDERSRRLGAELGELYARMEEIERAGEDPSQIRSEILSCTHKIRAGSQLRPGDRLADGRFLILKMVGRGGFGVVWKAHDQEKDEFVAIKVLSAEHAREEAIRRRFFRGARVMGSLKHRHIVRVNLENGTAEYPDGFLYFFVMEFLAGGDFQRAVLQHRFGPENALRVILQAGSGLQRAHDRRLIHRDVSPDNILLDETGSARLTDFDLVLADDTTGHTKSGVGMGKYYYIAPEVADRAKNANIQTDIYALGMTAIFALHGIATGTPLPYSVVARRQSFMDSLMFPAATREILLKAIALDCSDRYPTVSAFCADLTEALGRRAVLPGSTLQSSKDLLLGLEEDLTRSNDPVERLAKYHQIAMLYETHLLALEDALEAELRALREYPEDPYVRHESERLARSVEDGWERVARAYADVPRLHAGEDVRRAAAKRLARLFEAELDDVAKAEEVYRGLFNSDPNEDEAFIALSRIYTALERYRELAWLLRIRASTATEPHILIELHARLGRLYEQLQQQEDAIWAYRRIFDELDRSNDESIRALERLYTTAKSSSNLRQVLERTFEVATHQDTRLHARERLIAVLVDLEEIYESTSQWEELYEVLARRAVLATDDRRPVGVWLRCAKLLHERLGRDGAALEAYGRVLSIDATNLEARRGIGEIRRKWSEAPQPPSATPVKSPAVDVDKGSASPFPESSRGKEAPSSYDDSEAVPRTPDPELKDRESRASDPALPIHGWSPGKVFAGLAFILGAAGAAALGMRYRSDLLGTIERTASSLGAMTSQSPVASTTMSSWPTATASVPVDPPKDAGAVVQPSPALDAGGSGITKDDCPENMTYIPTGNFIMGIENGQGSEYDSPEHPVTVKAFCIGRTEVTIEDYKACVAAQKQGGCKPPDTSQVELCSWDEERRAPNKDKPKLHKHPMSCVTWYEAQAYCKWAPGGNAAAQKRLPREEEWEYAARGAKGWRYPWGGNTIYPEPQTRMNVCEKRCKDLKELLKADNPKTMYGDVSDGWDKTAPVGSFPKGVTPSGLSDMAGNVAEFTSGQYCQYNNTSCKDDRRVARGGHWWETEPVYVSTYHRNAVPQNERRNFIGFRCVLGEVGSDSALDQRVSH
jgi:formylglycine-generating enzyme required for sulfatase activity/serine/threonine protein kinase